MDKIDIRTKLDDIIAKILGLEKDQITSAGSFINDFGADSLDIVELVIEVERDFELSIPDEDIEKIITVNDAVEYLSKRLS